VLLPEITTSLLYAFKLQIFRSLVRLSKLWHKMDQQRFLFRLQIINLVKLLRDIVKKKYERVFCGRNYPEHLKIGHNEKKVFEPRSGTNSELLNKIT